FSATTSSHYKIAKRELMSIAVLCKRSPPIAYGAIAPRALRFSFRSKINQPSVKVILFQSLSGIIEFLSADVLIFNFFS
ncbi:MAG: hypothetical protein KAJ48_11075, partial [Elusimicrobiales bacterium]|nr:hypothetical protein [Elusimicrobiales bacterium]